MTQVCRTCLEEITDLSFLSLSDASNKVKDELALCVPELDLGLVPHATVCIYCARALHAAYDFKQKCLQTEERIRTHMQDKALLDLEQIKQEAEVDSKIQVEHGQGLGMEVIYIRDDDLSLHDCELITGDVNEPTPTELQVEPVKLFLNVNHDLSSQIIAGGFSDVVRPHSTIGQLHSLNIKKRKSIKKEPKSFYNGDDDVARSFDCPHCSFRASRAYNLKQHMKSHNVLKSKDLPIIHNGENCFRCNFCDFTTDSKIKLSVHAKNHTSTLYSCPSCNFQTHYKVALYNHMKLHNSVLSSPVAKKPFKEAKPYRCKQCPFYTVQKQVWLHHVESHAAEKNLKCSSCNYVASNLTTFQRHLSTHALKKPIKIAFKADADLFAKGKEFKCPHCPYIGPNRHRLAAHILVHTGEKPFECHLCNYRANQKGHLDKHMQNHSGDRPWKCNICSYSVSMQFHLQQHMKVHSEGKPVQPKQEGMASAQL